MLPWSFSFLKPEQFVHDRNYLMPECLVKLPVKLSVPGTCLYVVMRINSGFI